MRIRSTFTLFPLFFSPVPALIGTKGFDCTEIVKDDIKYSLEGLRGAHTVSHVEYTDTAVVSMTYVVNLCAPLRAAANWEDLRCGTHKSSMY